MGKFMSKLSQIFLCPFMTMSMTWSGLSLAQTSPHNQEPGEFYRFYRIRIEPGSPVLDKLVSKGFDITGRNIEKGTVDVLAHHQNEVAEISKWDSVILTSWEGDAQKAPDPQYKTPDEVKQILDSYVTKYGSLASLHSIGKSVEGRDIWALRITSQTEPAQKSKPAILFNGMHHAREVMTPEVVLDTIDQLLTRYDRDPQITQWVNRTEIWLIPMLNPDGNQRVWTRNAMWRKNTRGGYGVDINRNYPYRWGGCQGSSGNTQSETYRGPVAASEPETMALMNLVALAEPVFNISYHSYSEMVLFPYGCDGARAETKEIVEPIGRAIAAVLPRESSSGTYAAGTSWEILYSVDGSDMDWMYHEHHVLPFVIELNSDEQGFQPPYQWRQPTVERMRAAWQMLFERLEQTGIHGVIELSDGSRQANLPIKVEQETSRGLTTVLETRSKKNGSFHVILNPGTYKVTFGSGTMEKILWLPLGTQRFDIDVTLDGGTANTHRKKLSRL
jgi:carboxypeptidase T